MNSTPGIRASTIRLTALTPAPPTPTTRITGWCGSPLPGRPYRGDSTIGSNSRRCCGSSENTRLSRSGGVSVDPSESSSLETPSGPPASDESVSPAGGVDDGTSPAACEDDVPSSATGPAGRALSSPAVDRKRPERGPSRILARLRRLIGKNLLRQLPVVVRGAAAGIVLEHARSLHRCLGELDRLANAGFEDELAEVLFENLDRLLGVHGPRVEHRRQDALDPHLSVEVLLDHLQRVLELDQSAL